MWTNELGKGNSHTRNNITFASNGFTVRQQFRAEIEHRDARQDSNRSKPDLTTKSTKRSKGQKAKDNGHSQCEMG